MIADALSLIYDYGWFFAIFITIAVVLGKFVLNNYEDWLKDKDEEDLDRDSLKQNSFFTNSEYRLSVEIANLQLVKNKPNRELIFKDLLKIYIKTIYEITKDLIDLKELDEWDSTEWVNNVTQIINKMVIQAEDKARKEGIPEIVIRKFWKLHLETIEVVKNNHILSIGNSKIYSSNLIKTHTLLMVLDLLVITILGDAERVLHTLNGEISGLNYKGIIIE